MSPDAELITGAEHSDARGRVRFVNDFKPNQAERFYCIYPATPGEVRGWVGHRRYAKWFFVVRGEVKIGVVQPDNWDSLSSDLPVAVYTLTDDCSQAVPHGHFTASIALVPNSIILVFSTGRLEDASSDDFRVAADHWLLTEGSPSFR
jgi:hypothetical protein